MKIRILKKGLPKAQIVGEIKTPNQVVLNGTMYFEGQPGYEEAKREADLMKSQMFNLRGVNNTIQDLKNFVPKIKPAVGNAMNTAVTEVKEFLPTVKPAVNNAVQDVKEFLPRVRPAINNAFQGVKQFASNTFPKINLGSGTQSQPQASQQAATQEPAQASGSTSMQPWAFLNPDLFKTTFENDIVSPRTDYNRDTQAVKDEKLRQKYPTLGATPQQQQIEKAGMATPLSNLTVEPEPFDIGKAARTVSAIGDGLQIAGAAVDYFDQNRKRKEFDRNFRRNQFDIQATSPMFRGNWNINTGRFRDDVTKQPNEGMFQMGGEENFINVEDTMKIRITGRPQNLEFEYGGQSGFGLDLGQRRVQTEMPQSKADSVRTTIQEVPREEANIEAEDGETLYGDLDGDGFLEHMKIGGERHYNGGTPLNVPEGTFVFSDTAKMKIKDPEVLKFFGLPAKKGGYTPAEIAKRYDVNKYKAIIEDENADETDKTTASLMVKNLQAKLSKLAMVQESMKGFPQGIPAVAQESKNEMAMAKYGGSLPKFQGDTSGSTVNRVSVWDEEEQKTLQDYIKKNYNVEIPINARDTDPNSQRFTLPIVQPMRGGRRVYGDEDWTSAENMADFAKRQKNFMAQNLNWDPTAVGSTEKFQRWYDEERAKKGLDPYFNRGQRFQKYDDKFGEYTFSAPDIEPTSPPPTTVPEGFPGFICSGLKDDGTPNINQSNYPSEEARRAAGAYATSQEAAMHCPGGSIPGKIREGEIPKEQKPGFLTPDKLALLNAGLNPPKAYFPYAPPVNFRKGNLTLDDWLAQAQQRGSMMNTAASTLGQYQPGTALASNLSFLAGQTGEGVSQDIATVNSRNVDRANQFMSQEVQRQGYNDMLNAQRMQELFDKGTITKQQYDNALKKYTSGITSAANNAWANRMYLDMINKVNPIFNVDPRSGLSYFKQGYGTDMFGRTGSNPGFTMADFSKLKNQNLQYGMSEANAEAEALKRIRGGNTSYSDTNVDGLPDSVRTTVPGGGVGLANAYMSAFGNFKPPFSMYGGQIGPWVNKKKK